MVRVPGVSRVGIANVGVNNRFDGLIYGRVSARRDVNLKVNS
jgi:hypothetical protein